MAMFKKLAALGAAAEAARRYAQKNPDKVRQFTDKAATFADKQTKGKYSNQINQAKHKVTEVAGVPESNPTTYPGQQPPTSQYQPPGQQSPEPKTPPTPFKRDA